MTRLWLVFMGMWLLTGALTRCVVAPVSAQDLGERAIQEVYREALTPHAPFSRPTWEFGPSPLPHDFAPPGFPAQGLYAPPSSPRGLQYNDVVFGQEGEFLGFFTPPSVYAPSPPPVVPPRGR